MCPQNEAERSMRARTLLPALLALALAGCDDALTTLPVNEVADAQAITDAKSARAALAGAYDGLQDSDYYGGYFLAYGDLPTEDVEHTGTWTWFADVDGLNFRADNSGFTDIWDAIYVALGRVNVLIERLPDVAGLDTEIRDQYLGEAYFLRALHFHNAVKLWGDVPMPTSPVETIEEASQISRTSVADVYAQSLSDLDRAEQLLNEATQTRYASLGAVHALRTRILLHMEDWTGVVDEAAAVEALGYELAPSYADLFDAEGADTPEDIFRIAFTPQEQSSEGFYYLSRSAGGRAEVAPTATLEGAFESGDVRDDWMLATGSDGALYGAKWPTSVGSEDVHVLRLAEVILNKAEALAHMNLLDEAVAEYNRIRGRAHLEPHVLGVDVDKRQQAVLDAIWRERRTELAMEGFRWPELVRTGRAVALLGVEQHQTLWPIPQSELDVAPNLEQNPGY